MSVAHEKLSLLDFILHLLDDDVARQQFADDPDAELAEHGLSDLSSADVHDALVLINEDNQDGDFSRDYNTGSNSAHLAAVPVHHGGESTVQYIHRYLVENHVDDRDTITDSSINQQIDTGGGDFDQDIDIDSVVASGDGAVAAGDDIDGSTIVTGDGNQVGDGNVAGDGNVVGDGNEAVTGDDNTTSFGRGDATSTEVGGDVNVGDGAAFASGGDADVDNSDNSTNDSGNTDIDESINDSFHDHSDNSTHDSGNTVVDASTEDSGNTDVDNSIDDSFDHNRIASYNIDIDLDCDQPV